MSSPSDKDRPRRSASQVLKNLLTIEQIYLLLSAFLVLYLARVFYGSLRMQTEQAVLWFEPERYSGLIHGTDRAPWSAPLDDVFIHFDFARATAQGHPFEWIAGNGYSSGGTSLLYPFVLAAGYLAGYTGLSLMHWAAIVACVGTFATLLGARRLFSKLPAWTALLAPPIFLSVGALDWTLYSGMEVAMFLALWALSVVLWDDLLEAIAKDGASRMGALTLGLACALLVAGRPEAAPIVAIFGVYCASAWWSRGKRHAAIQGLILIGAPGALVVGSHMVANHVLTGSSAAAGALAKLEMHHPYLTDEQVWNSWVFFLKYQFLRLSDYHFGGYILGIPGSGFLVWPVALLSVVFQKTRRYGILLLLSALIWFMLVALNGQVRWQNERYTMPAVAWLLLAAAVGIAGALDWAWNRREELAVAPLRKFGVPALLLTSCVLFYVGQRPRFRDQVWFFGRASRNILEQHVRAASAMRQAKPPLHRVLLSDAGAIPYISDLPAFDLIGLGGYGRLPIAGASRQGVGAAIELLEYMPSSDLPDVMALYPSWWGDFVLWFGRRVDEFPVRGNVIAGGASKVIYAPRWAPILHSGEPIFMNEGERLVDTVDVADVINEKAHQVSWDRPAQGYVSMKMLPDARNTQSDLWDAGRLLAPDMSLFFHMSGFQQQNAELLIRVAPAHPVKLELSDDSGASETVSVEAADHWQEIRLPIHPRQGKVSLSLKPVEGDIHVFHIFAVESSPANHAAAPTPQDQPTTLGSTQSAAHEPL